MTHPGPHINHVEQRAYRHPVPLQYVSDTHDDRKEPAPVKEVNAMTALLAALRK
jgi:hypothetical protein